MERSCCRSLNQRAGFADVTLQYGRGVPLPRTALYDKFIVRVLAGSGNGESGAKGAWLLAARGTPRSNERPTGGIVQAGGAAQDSSNARSRHQQDYPARLPLCRAWSPSSDRPTRCRSGCPGRHPGEECVHVSSTPVRGSRQVPRRIIVSFPAMVGSAAERGGFGPGVRSRLSRLITERAAAITV
jgi:hypothetical protein